MPNRPPIWAMFSNSCLEVRVLRLSNSFHNSRTCEEASPVVFSTPVIRSDILRSSSVALRALPANVEKKPVIRLPANTPRMISPKREVRVEASVRVLFTWLISSRTRLKCVRASLNWVARCWNSSVPGERFRSSRESARTSRFKAVNVFSTSLPLMRMVSCDVVLLLAILIHYYLLSVRVLVECSEVDIGEVAV